MPQNHHTSSQTQQLCSIASLAASSQETPQQAPNQHPQLETNAVEKFATKQEKQTLATSWAHLYLLLGDSKVSSMHCQSPVQYSEKQYGLPRSQKRCFQALAA